MKGQIEKIVLSEKQIKELFQKQLFEVSTAKDSFMDWIIKRQFSYERIYRIGLTFNPNNLEEAVDNLLSDSPKIDKLLIANFSSKSNQEILKPVIENTDELGSKIEVLSPRSLLNLEKTAFCDIQLERELKKGKSSGEAYAQLLKDVSDKLSELILKEEKTLWSIEWRDFEKLICELFSGLGFETTLTSSSGDGGKDVICKVKNNKEVYYIELKLWSSQKVGKAIVKKLETLIIDENINNQGIVFKGLIISPKGFQNDIAIAHEVQNSVYIGDMNKVMSLCRRFVKVKSGLYVPHLSFNDIIAEDTITSSHSSKNLLP